MVILNVLKELVERRPLSRVVALDMLLNLCQHTGNYFFFFCSNHRLRLSLCSMIKLWRAKY
jgi:hypothetical protein